MDMSLTDDLPPDLDRQVREIPDVGERVIAFLRNQVEHEQWRKGRYSEKARQIVQDGLSEANRLREEGVSREEAFRRFFATYDEVMGRNI